MRMVLFLFYWNTYGGRGAWPITFDEPKTERYATFFGAMIVWLEEEINENLRKIDKSSEILLDEDERMENKDVFLQKWGEGTSGLIVYQIKWISEKYYHMADKFIVGGPRLL